MGSSFPLTFIFFRGVETTNQYIYIYIFVISTCCMLVFHRFQLQITKSIMLRGSEGLARDILARHLLVDIQEAGSVLGMNLLQKPKLLVG